MLRNDDYIIVSRSASYDLNREAGVFSNSEFTLLSRGARGKVVRGQPINDCQRRRRGVGAPR